MFVIGTDALAQQAAPVAVLAVDTSRDACEVQKRRRFPGGGETWRNVGDPMACSGALVVAYITTQADAAARQAEARAGGAQDVRVVSLSGDTATDEGTVQAWVTALHEGYDSGFVDPAEPPSGRASSCQNGDPIDTERAEDYRIRVNTAETRVVGSVLYRRVSCERWIITAVTMEPRRPPTIRLYFRDFFYRSPVDDRQAGAQCWLLRTETQETFEPNWRIQARGKALVELVDRHPNAGGTWPCALGAGTSFTSSEFRLHGGTR